MSEEDRYSIDLLKQWINDYKLLSASMDKVNDFIGGDADSLMQKPIWRMFGHYTDCVADDVGCNSETLEWFIYDNQCGARGLEAGYDDKMKPIKTIEALFRFIREGKNR